MKTLLNFLIGFFIILMASDCENNANAAVLNYSNSVICIAALTVLGFLRIYHKEFTDFLTKYQ